MIQVEFNYNGILTIIQSNKNEKMIEIFKKFSSKAEIDINSVFFIYNGLKVKEELTLDKCINSEDLEIKNMKIIAYQLNLEEENKVNQNAIIESKDIICPICKEICKIELKNYKIFSSECINNHIHSNLFLKDYKNTQKINQNEIKCSNEQCLKKKSETYNGEFFICNSCNAELCPLCRNNHDKEHKIIKYEEKNYICKLHNMSFSLYCKICNTNLCILCEKDHKEHKVISLGKLLPDLNYLKMKNIELKNSLDMLKENINVIINKLNEIIKDLEIYYEINNKIFNNFNIKNINYEMLWNFNQFNINNDIIINDIIKINDEKNIKEKINKLIDIYNKMNAKDNEIEILYNIKENEKEIKIFGDLFVKNNKKICKIIYGNKKYELTDSFKINNLENKNNIFKINLICTSNITNMSGMFEYCQSLISLLNISNLNTSKVNDMSSCFKFCNSLSTLEDISEWNTSNVTNMKAMFAGCSSLTSLPDISKWNTSNITDMSFMFCGCPLLKYLPDIP